MINSETALKLIEIMNLVSKTCLSCRLEQDSLVDNYILTTEYRGKKVVVTYTSTLKYVIKTQTMAFYYKGTVLEAYRQLIECLEFSRIKSDLGL